MNKKVLIFMAAIAILVSGSCLSNRGIDNEHNAKNSIDWVGVYEGTIPAADCDGIEVSIELFKDQTFEMSYKYIDKSPEPILWKGKFTWDNTGNVVIFDTKDGPNYYKIAENKLIQLDMKGKPIKGKLADNYILWRIL